MLKAGSALGAERHWSPVPWDPKDIDLAVFETNITKIIEAVVLARTVVERSGVLRGPTISRGGPRLRLAAWGDPREDVERKGPTEGPARTNPNALRFTNYGVHLDLFEQELEDNDDPYIDLWLYSLVADEDIPSSAFPRIEEPRGGPPTLVPNWREVVALDFEQTLTQLQPDADNSFEDRSASTIQCVGFCKNLTACALAKTNGCGRWYRKQRGRPKLPHYRIQDVFPLTLQPYGPYLFPVARRNGEWLRKFYGPKWRSHCAYAVTK